VGVAKDPPELNKFEKKNGGPKGNHGGTGYLPCQTKSTARGETEKKGGKNGQEEEKSGPRVTTSKKLGEVTGKKL